MRAFCVAALALLAACTFDPEKPDITATVVNISQDTTQNVDHLDVTLTFPDSTTKQFRPSFQPQALTTVDLAFSSGGQAGNFTLTVDEADRNGTVYATKTVPFTVTGGVAAVVPTIDLAAP
jgi:hypothetical protein